MGRSSLVRSDFFCPCLLLGALVVAWLLLRVLGVLAAAWLLLSVLCVLAAAWLLCLAVCLAVCLVALLLDCIVLIYHDTTGTGAERRGRTLWIGYIATFDEDMRALSAGDREHTARRSERCIMFWRCFFD